MARIDTIVFVNNALSARLAHDDLVRNDVSLDRVALFLLRRLTGDWFQNCAMVLDYGRAPAQSLLRQLEATGFYVRAARVLRKLLHNGSIARVYLVNNDNLLTSHTLSWAVSNPDCEVTVVVEGLMNFQDIRLRNRQPWRSRVKTLVAPLLRLTWNPPGNHLSGAFDSRVDRVLTFEREGLKSPLGKIDERRLVPLNPPSGKQDRAALVALSGIWQWITPEEDTTLSQGFVDWLVSQNFDRVLVKPHPHVSGGALELMLADYARIDSTKSLEDLAGELVFGTVAGVCCTGLVTLKQLRPDLRCVDYGCAYYCERAYFGDHSVQRLMESVGVEQVEAVSM